MPFKINRCLEEVGEKGREEGKREGRAERGERGERREGRRERGEGRGERGDQDNYLKRKERCARLRSVRYEE